MSETGLDSKTEDRFWAKVNKNGPVSEHCPELGPCWIWTASLGSSGYGQFYLGKRQRKAHIIAWELTNGAIPNGIRVCHKCDERPCVNPTHMFLGTQSENLQDMVTKKRYWAYTNPEKLARGDRHGSHTHPERWARGDAHWSRRCPEKVARQEHNGMNTHPESRAIGTRNGRYTHPESRSPGERNGMSSLTNEQVQEIRERYSPGRITQSELAKEFGISQSTVGNIIHKRTWGHLGEQIER